MPRGPSPLPEPEACASIIRQLLSHVSEMDTADLPVVDGQVVRIVALSEVESWLEGLELRARNGVIL